MHQSTGQRRIALLRVFVYFYMCQSSLCPGSGGYGGYGPGGAGQYPGSGLKPPKTGISGY